LPARLLVPFGFEWIKRKVDALVERRIGPPLLQPVYDWFKLWGNETLLPDGAGIFFRLAPWLLFLCSLVAVYVASIRPPWALLELLALLSTMTLLKMFLARAVTSPFTIHGLGRLGSMKLALDPAFPLAFLAAAFLWGFDMNWPLKAAILLPLAVATALAELELPPFDLSHAKSELVAGWKTELSGRWLALVTYAENARMVAVSLMLAALLGPTHLWLKATLIFTLLSALSIALPRMHLAKAIRWLSFLNVLALAEVIACLSWASWLV